MVIFQFQEGMEEIDRSIQMVQLLLIMKIECNLCLRQIRNYQQRFQQCKVTAKIVEMIHPSTANETWYFQLKLQIAGLKRIQNTTILKKCSGIPEIWSQLSIQLHHNN